MIVTFTTDGDDDLATVEADAVPRIGEMVSIKENAPSGIAIEYHVINVLWRVAQYGCNTKMGVFVFIHPQKPLNKYEWLKGLMGLTEEDARKYVSAQGYRLRITGRDGVRYPCTAGCDYERINIYTEGGIVTEVGFG